MVRLLACAMAVLLACSPCATAQGALERARFATLDRSTPAPSSKPATSSSTSSDGDGQWFDGNDAEGTLALLLVAGAVASSPIWAPMALLGDNLFTPGYFPGHPYARESPHYIDSTGFAPQNSEAMSLLDPAYLKPWAVRLLLENGNDFNGLNRLGGQINVDTACRFGVLTKWNYFYENVGAGHSDSSVLGDIDATWRFAQADWIQMYTGVGARIQADRHGTRGGFNFLYGADVFPIDPVVISVSIDLGNLDSAFLVHARGTIGWQIGRFELFGGYDFLRIGTVNLQGPMAGVRLWF